MARINIAMLAQEEQIQIQTSGDELITDSGALEIQQVSNDIDTMDGVIDETRAAAGAMDGLAEKIQAQQAVSEDAIQIAQEMITYFGKRTGVKFQGVSAAMESYDAGNPVKKDQIVKELKLASESYKGQIRIAQEGIIDRIKYKFSLVFSNSDKLKKELAEASGAYDEKGGKEGTIENPAFARIFYIPGRTSITGSEVIALATKVANGIGNRNLITTVEKITRIVNGLTLAVSKGGLFSDKESVREIETLYRELEELNSNVHSEFNIEINKKNISVTPLKQDEKQKLEKLIIDLLDTGDYESAEVNLYRAVDAFSNAYSSAKDRRLFDDYATDLNIAAEVEDFAHDTYGILSKLVSYGFDVAHASVKYIKASTQK